MKNEEDLKQVYRKKYIAARKAYTTKAVRALLLPVVAALKEYFATDYSVPVEDCIVGLSHGLWRAGVNRPEASSSQTDEPCRGWNDVTDVFDIEDTLLSETEEKFVASIQRDVEAMNQVGEEVLKSDIVEKWIAELKAAPEEIRKRLQLIASTAKIYAMPSPAEAVLNPVRINSAPDIKAVAEEIYMGRHYLELIRAKGLTVYVPPQYKE